MNMSTEKRLTKDKERNKIRNPFNWKVNWKRQIGVDTGERL